MQVTISLKKDVKAEVKQSLTKRFALTVFKTARTVAEHGKNVPTHLTRSFADVRDAWNESQPKNI